MAYMWHVWFIYVDVWLSYEFTKAVVQGCSVESYS